MLNRRQSWRRAPHRRQRLSRSDAEARRFGSMDEQLESYGRCAIGVEAAAVDYPRDASPFRKSNSWPLAIARANRMGGPDHRRGENAILLATLCTGATGALTLVPLSTSLVGRTHSRKSVSFTEVDYHVLIPTRAEYDAETKSSLWWTTGDIAGFAMAELRRREMGEDLFEDLEEGDVMLGLGQAPPPPPVSTATATSKPAPGQACAPVSSATAASKHAPVQAPATGSVATAASKPASGSPATAAPIQAKISPAPMKSIKPCHHCVAQAPDESHLRAMATS
mmetsp:Transcript_22480/g.69631  ORF Transcript_22480/g.69631 Transcript_22480/m.69631 type:complete len:281 (+) Transcript_22480:296-1138(+)